MAKVYGKISYGWHGTIVLPIGEAAQLVELIATGLMRDVGSWPDKGLTDRDASGRPMAPPELTVLSQAQYDELIQAGRILYQGEQDERAAREAAERKAKEPAEA